MTAAVEPATAQPPTQPAITVPGPADPALGVNVIDHILELLNSVDLHNGETFIKTSAVMDGGYIRIEIRRVNFDHGDDVIVTQLLHPVEPVAKVEG